MSTPGVGSQKSDKKTTLIACCLSSVICLLASSVTAQDDPLKLVETKRLELKQREEALAREERQLNVLRKEVEEKIETYTKLLARVEALVNKVDQVKGEKLENVVKAYESMPPGDAAERLSALDDDTALLIMARMKSKKAGAIIAIMEPRKAAALTRSMTDLSISRPGQ